MKVNYLLIDQVKAQFTLTIELISITKRAKKVPPGGKYPLKDLDSAYKVSKEIIFI